ncbi:MAG: nucleotidyltransferase family protein [Saprospiraceae bacterium]
MAFHSIIEKNRSQLAELCQRYEVEKLFVFGSAATGKFKAKTSDLDFIAIMNSKKLPEERGEAIINLWDALEKLFDRKVDLITKLPIRNPYLRKSIEATKQLIYDRQSEKIPV